MPRNTINSKFHLLTQSKKTGLVYDLDYVFCKIHHKLNVQGTLPQRTTFTPYKEIFTATYQYSLTFNLPN